LKTCASRENYSRFFILCHQEDKQIRMGSNLFGYVAVILLQQLMIVGLAFGIVQLFDRQRHLRRLTRTVDARKSAELKLSGHALGGPQFQAVLPEPALELQLVKNDCVLTSIET